MFLDLNVFQTIAETIFVNAFHERKRFIPLEPTVILHKIDFLFLYFPKSTNVSVSNVDVILSASMQTIKFNSHPN